MVFEAAVVASALFVVIVLASLAYNPRLRSGRYIPRTETPPRVRV